MSKLQNSIGWCDDTGNKVIGCDKVSPGCKNCYAAIGTIARVMRHRAVNPVETWGPQGTRIAVADFTAKIRRLNKLCICDKCHETQPVARVGKECGMLPKGQTLADNECTGHLRRIRQFADSNSDWLDDRWDIETLAEFLDEIRRAPNVDNLLLTKRIDSLQMRLRATFGWAQKNENFGLADWLIEWFDGKEPKNIWLGVSVEDNDRRTRIGMLKNTPATVRFISFEPLLEDLPSLELSGIDWAIVGYESGQGRRDPKNGIQPLLSVVEQCLAQSVPVYVKQDLAFKAGQQGRIPDDIWRLKQFPKQER